MVHGILSKVRPHTPTVDELGAIGAGSLFGTFSQLRDLGFVGGQRDNVNLGDTVRADVSRPTKPNYEPVYNRSGRWPTRRDKVDIPFLIPTHRPPDGEPTPVPETPHSPFVSETTQNEALQARDRVDVQTTRGREQTPVIIGPPGTGMTFIGIKTDPYYKIGKVYRSPSGKVQSPCLTLDNARFSLERRKHRKTGKSGARLRQIRREYAYRHCR